jgi:hypothetical protein
VPVKDCGPGEDEEEEEEDEEEVTQEWRELQDEELYERTAHQILFRRWNQE